MTGLGITGLINFFACILLAVFVFQNKQKNSIAVAYAIFNTTVGLYSLFYFFWQTSHNVNTARIFFLLLFVGVIWINQAYLYFIYSFVGNFQKRHKVFLACFFVNCIFTLLAISWKIFESVELRQKYGFWPNPTNLFVLYLIFWHIECVLGFSELLFHARTVSGIQRQQVKYLIFGFSIGYLGGATNWPMWFNMPFPPYGNGFIAIYDAIIAYAIMRHRLMDITLIIRKTVIYSVVVGTLAFLYWGIVTTSIQFFQGLTGSQTVFSSAVAAGLIAFLFQPLRKKIQILVDEKFFRQYVDREEKLYELSREVVTHTTPEAMADAIMRVLGDTLHPKGAALFLKAADGNGFVQVFSGAQGKLPDRVPNEDPLPQFFIDHPQPFVQDASADQGSSFDTRRPHRTGESA